jgi:hypothetical protein
MTGYFLRAFILSLILWQAPANALPIRIPVPTSQGIKLGQGFDMGSMDWKEVCTVGREVVLPPNEATIESSSDLSSRQDMETINGTLAAGVSLLGGLAEAKAKVTFFKSWLGTEQSAANMFRLSLGQTYWYLRDSRPALPLVPEVGFKDRCGDHVVVGLEVQNDLLLLMKYTSTSDEWMQKVRMKVKAKGLWGMAQKSWTKEEIDSAAEARATVKVGVVTKGYFNKLLSTRLGTLESTEMDCQYPSVSRCDDLYDQLAQIIDFVKINTHRINLQSLLIDKDLVTAVIIVPYDEVGPHFQSLSQPKYSYKKVEFLNTLRTRLFELEAQAQELALTPNESSTISMLNTAILELKNIIERCERENLCE